MTPAPSVLLPLLCLAVAAECESAISISSDGIIHVLVTTSGSGSDSDGFTLTVDGGDARFVSNGGSIALEGLTQGTHTVLLSGVAANCTVQGDNPRSVVVGADGAVSVSFSVTCGSASTRYAVAASAARAWRLPSSRSTKLRMAAPTTKKMMTDRIAFRLDPVAAIVPAKISGPKIPANFSNTLKKPKNSPDLWCGIMLANSERLSAWVPPCTTPTNPASTKKCSAVFMK